MSDNFQHMSSKSLYTIIFILICLNAVTLIAFFSTPGTASVKTNPSSVVSNVPEKKEEIELAVFMGRMQRFSDKLYFAGKNQNWELAKFYLHELEETAEEVEDAKIIEDGHDISKLIGTMLGTTVEATEKTVLNNPSVEKFEENYRAMVAGCNNCHKATDHGFIQISIPKEPTYRNQLF